MKRLAAAILCAALVIRSACTASPKTQYLALTFDDGPSGALTDRLLDTLADSGAHATFFVCAYRVRQYPDRLQRIAREGHEIGLHTCCHADLRRLTYEQTLEDLAECQIAVTECCGVRARLLRPPEGFYGRQTLRAAHALGLSVVLWSVDTDDWDASQRADVLPRILRGASDGAVILLHELSEHSVRCAAEAIRQLQARGFVFVTLSELAARSRTELLPGTVYRSFPVEDG